ncbi:hypothetical protein OG792_11240 [Micromonospora sp. NBC_01699]|uniref:hypothetical protein n=1 Tax=Micromonospora sp. NBC_01699 TaxID=2975984 RepID=UPI002E366D1A|nr:hypothetical protein [Micromonospora sp. NBC_01699]
MSETENRTPTTDNDGVRERRGSKRREIVTISLTAIGVIIGVLAWQLPQSGPSGSPPGGAVSPPASTATGTGTPPTPPGPTTGPPAITHFDGLELLTGNANLVDLPRGLENQPGYEHRIVIQCPSNRPSDKTREVGYQLSGRYLDLSTTVRPHFPTGRADARVEVIALAVTKNRDQTLTSVTKGQVVVANGATAPLTAAVDGADQLTIQVKCEWPEGVVILTDAGLSRAPA